MKLTPEMQKALPMPISQLGLKARSENVLENNKIFTVEQLLMETRESLLALKGMGHDSLADIFNRLAEIGFVTQSHGNGSVNGPEKAPKNGQ